MNNKIAKLRKDRCYLRRLLHKIKLQIAEHPTDELYKQRKSYRKRLSKINSKILELKKGTCNSFQTF